MSQTAQTENPRLFLMTNTFETGGSERQFVELARSLRASSFHLDVGCIARRGVFIEGLGEILEFPVGGNLYGVESMRARIRLARQLKALGTTVANAFDFYSNLLLIPAARMAGVRVVIGSQRQLGDLLTPAKSFVQRCAFRMCDRIVCNSRAAAERLIQQGLSARKISIIGNGIPFSAFEEAVPRSHGKFAALRIAMIARMNTESKNHRIFLRAASVLIRQFPNAEFLLAGDGPLRSSLELEAKELGIADRVLFLGDCRDIPAILATADISVLPSASESLSNAVLESMAAGVPVVASNVGGNPELISGDRGILVSPGDPNEVARAVKMLLENPELRARFAGNGQSFVRSRFAIDAVRRQYEELYRDLLRSKTMRSAPAVPRSLTAVPDRQLKTAIVAASSAYVGGQSVQAEALLSSWCSDKDVKAHFIPIDPKFPHWLRWAGSIPLLRTLIREPIYVTSLWRGLKGTDVAHIFSASYWSFLIAPTPALLIARARGAKVLIHYHSGEARDHLRRFRAARYLLSRADCIVVPSEYLVAVFREFGISADAIPNIVELNQFSFRERVPLRPHFLCTRGFHHYYRVDLVVRAFGEVQREFPDAQLDLVGSGGEELRIRKLVSELKLERVNFIGVISRREIARHYSAADIFLNASDLDNMPVSILEAFASGTPVVSTAAEGIRYLVGHERTGLLCEAGDWRALAQNAIRLLRDPLLSSTIAARAVREAQRYSWGTAREAWVKKYRSLIFQGQAATEECSLRSDSSQMPVA